MTENDSFNPQFFIEKQVSEIRALLGGEKAIIACSGGVDSTTCAVLTRRAVGENLVCIFIDTNFMRLDEPERVVSALSAPPLGLPIKLIRAEERFMKALRGLVDAEEKRKAFRDIFYSVLRDAAAEENCEFLVQGTILPDILETVKGIKTQHNVLEQMKIDARSVYGFNLIEPLVTLYKFQVREVARLLGVPLETSERQPFPGPGLSVRVVGEITPAKLDAEKRATKIVEEQLEALKPKQFFPATIDSSLTAYSRARDVEKAISSLLKKEDTVITAQVLRTRATGIRGGTRLYGKVMTVEVQNAEGKYVELDPQQLDRVQETITEIDSDISRVLYKCIGTKQSSRWLIAVRAVETRDFVTASVFNIPWPILKKTGELLLASCKDVSAVYYDITPKPPASIEFE